MLTAKALLLSWSTVLASAVLRALTQEGCTVLLAHILKLMGAASIIYKLRGLGACGSSVEGHLHHGHNRPEKKASHSMPTAAENKTGASTLVQAHALTLLPIMALYQRHASRYDVKV